MLSCGSDTIPHMLYFFCYLLVYLFSLPQAFMKFMLTTWILLCWVYSLPKFPKHVRVGNIIWFPDYNWQFYCFFPFMSSGLPMTPFSQLWTLQLFCKKQAVWVTTASPSGQLTNLLTGAVTDTSNALFVLIDRGAQRYKYDTKLKYKWVLASVLELLVHM